MRENGSDRALDFEGQTLLLSDCSERPSILKIFGIVFAVDFLLCLLYGVAIGFGGSIDAQMRGAPLFLLFLTCFSVVFFVILLRKWGKRVTTIEIYEKGVRFSAPKIPVMGENVPSVETARDVGGSDRTSFDKDEPVHKENPYLKKKKISPKSSSNANFSSNENLSSGASRYSTERYGKREGKVTSDIANSEICCGFDQICLVHEKERELVITLSDGNRYLLVRMTQPKRLAEILLHKIGL